MRVHPLAPNSFQREDNFIFPPSFPRLAIEAMRTAKLVIRWNRKLKARWKWKEVVVLQYLGHFAKMYSVLLKSMNVSLQKVFVIFSFFGGALLNKKWLHLFFTLSPSKCVISFLILQLFTKFTDRNLLYISTG